jgi:hypothetical protein
MKGGGRRTYKKYLKPLTGSVPSPTKTDDCEKINFITLLVKVQSALSSHDVGDKFSVVVEGQSLAAQDNDDRICGYITGLNNEQVTECIKQGKKFTATIASLDGKRCEVIVKCRR